MPDANKIKRALDALHLAEKGNGGDRVAAYKLAIAGSQLTSVERRVLRDAVHLTAQETGDA